MDAQTGAEFILRLEGVTLPGEVQHRIASALEATLMREFAHVDLRLSPVAKTGERLAGLFSARLSRRIAS